MKYNLFIIVLLTGNFLFAQIITDGLVGYWPFDGSTTDLSNNQNNGVLKNGVSLNADRFNNLNSAYYFDGVDDHIIINHISQYEFGEGDFSYSFWLKRASLNTRHDPFVKKTPSNTESFAIYIPNNELRLYLKGNGITNDYKIADINDLDWTHIGIVRLNGITSMYLDGILVDTKNTPGDMTFNGPLYIGSNFNSNGSPSFPFHGAIDDVYLFNRALSQEEIQQISNNDQQNSTICSSIFCDNENVGIGTSDTKGYKLAIAGKTIAEEVKIALISNWPDFIFKRNHELRTLEEVEEYINENSHLPEIPSEAEVTENGINLGEMNAKLLQKIEELTLYLIEQNKEVKDLKEKVKLLENK